MSKPLSFSSFSKTDAVFFFMAADWPICEMRKPCQHPLKLELVPELLFQICKNIILMFDEIWTLRT